MKPLPSFPSGLLESRKYIRDNTVDQVLPHAHRSQENQHIPNEVFQANSVSKLNKQNYAKGTKLKPKDLHRM